MRFEGTFEVVPWSTWCVTQKPYVSRRQIRAQVHWALPCHWNVVPLCWLLEGHSCDRLWKFHVFILPLVVWPRADWEWVVLKGLAPLATPSVVPHRLPLCWSLASLSLTHICLLSEELGLSHFMSYVLELCTHTHVWKPSSRKTKIRASKYSGVA